MSKALATRSAAMPANVAKDAVVLRLVDAGKALQQATNVQQAKLIMNVAAAQEVFAKRQQLGEDVIGYAHEIKIHALGRLGELLKDLPKAKGRSGPGRGKASTPAGPAFTDSSTLAELGITKQTSAVAQQLAALPADTREAIAQREVTLSKALREARHANVVAPEPIEGRFRCLLADPPWSYGNSGVITDSDAYGHAKRHYASMTIAELCALPVQQHVEDNSVLFLWVTAPLLMDKPGPREVIDAWGFKPKTGIVWDKQKHNFGHYVSVRHEHLLICTRGSCLPDRPTPMPDSVVSIERSDVHSEKPEEFRRLIEALYDGPYLELFGRRDAVENWTVYGNQLGVLRATA